MPGQSTTVADFAASLPTVHFQPTTPPHRDHPPYQEALEHDLSWWPQLGVVVVAKHALVKEMLADAQTYSSTNSLPPMTRGKPPAVAAALAGTLAETLMMVNADGDDHRRMRAIYTQNFTARVQSRAGLMRSRAVELVDAFAADGHAELHSQLAHPYLTSVYNDIFGIPARDALLFDRFERAAAVLLNPFLSEEDHVAAARLVREHQEYLDRLIDERLAEPRDDLLSDLLRGKDGEHLTHAEVHWLSFGVRVPSLETARLLILSVVDVMLRSGHWARAATADDRSRRRIIGRCVEETLRARSPVRGLMRTTTRSVTLGGQELPVGTPLVFFAGAANVDPEIFPLPEDIDLDRPNVRDHVAFGSGAHVCPGAGLARAEVLVAIEALLRRLPNLRLVDPTQRVQVPELLFFGPQHLHVGWDS